MLPYILSNSPKANIAVIKYRPFVSCLNRLKLISIVGAVSPSARKNDYRMYSNDLGVEFVVAEQINMNLIAPQIYLFRSRSVLISLFLAPGQRQSLVPSHNVHCTYPRARSFSIAELESGGRRPPSLG